MRDGSRPAANAAPRVPDAAAPGLLGRLRSAYYALALVLSESTGRRPRPRPERPAGRLPALDSVAHARVAALAARLPVPFEARYAADTALANYVYLDWLARLYAAAARPPPTAPLMHDVGSASFWYAAALVAFFGPRHLVGIEIEGRRRLRGGLTRHDRALGYVAALPGVEFRVADYTRVRAPVDVVTAFFPFVTPRPVLAWRLPLGVLAPAALFASVVHNLRPGGQFVMVNHGPEEAAVAGRFAAAAGLRALARLDDRLPLVPRTQPAVATLWNAS
jgi:SAM-dependent methyltransferase